MKRNVAAVLFSGMIPLAVLGGQPAAESGRSQHADLPIAIRIHAGDDAAAASWKAYEASVHRSLVASGTPREVALAALDAGTLAEDETPSRANTRDGELFRAAMGAPDDALVQWLIANRLLGSPDDARVALIIANATRLEPDNAAVWVLALALASRRQESGGIDDALVHMAASTRSDEHVADMLHAWLDVYQRNPPPPSMFVDPADADLAAFALAMAMAKTAALALPAYQVLIQACKPSADAGPEATRAADCAAVGRLMLHHSMSLIGRSIGFGLLRNLGGDVTTAGDRTANRNFEWIMRNAATTSGFLDKDRFAMQAHQADWRNLDDEYEIMQRGLRRAGLPVDAPPDWQPPQHAAIVQTESP